METLNNLVTVKRGIERQIMSANRHLNIIKREIDRITKRADNNDASAGSKEFIKPPQSPKPWKGGAENNALKVWDKLPPDGFTIADLANQANKKGPRRSSAAYFHVASRWRDMGFLEVAEEGSGRKPAKYRKLKWQPQQKQTET